MTDVRRKQDIDYYRVLQVDPAAEVEVIEAAYRALSKKYHPDVNRAPEAEMRMALINQAYDVLRDMDKRRDYNEIRDSLQRYARIRRETTDVVQPRPTAPEPTPRPRPTSSTEPARNKPRPNYFVEREELEHHRGFGVWQLAASVVAAIVIVVGTMLLLETIFGNPLSTSFIVSKADKTVTGTGQLVITAPPAPTNTPTPTGILSREGALAFLQTPDLFDRRVLDLTVNQVDKPDTLKITVRLSEKGGVTNAESVATAIKPDLLDTVRQSEATTYYLVYTLFRQYPDLNRLSLTLTDPKDEKRQVYRADMTRNTALNFYSWRGDMNPRALALVDLTRAAFEDRMNNHYGAPLDEQTHKQLSNPTSENIVAEIAAWINSDGVQVKIENSGTVNISYLLNKNDQEMKNDWARIFYGLYTRFPNIDRIIISKGLTGATNGEVRVCERALFNRITQNGWAQRLFAKDVADPKSIINSLPNDPTLTYQPEQTTVIEVKPGNSGKGKNWEISDPSKPISPTRINNLVSAKGKFLAVNLRITNYTSLKEWPNASQLFVLTDSQGNTYRPDTTASLVYYLTPPSNAAPYGPIDPGKSFLILLVFDIPENAANLRLQMLDDNTTVVMNLP